MLCLAAVYGEGGTDVQGQQPQESRSPNNRAHRTGAGRADGSGPAAEGRGGGCGRHVPAPANQARVRRRVFGTH